MSTEQTFLLPSQYHKLKLCGCFSVHIQLTARDDLWLENTRRYSRLFCWLLIVSWKWCRFQLYIGSKVMPWLPKKAQFSAGLSCLFFLVSDLFRVNSVLQMSVLKHSIPKGNIKNSRSWSSPICLKFVSSRCFADGGWKGRYIKYLQTFSARQLMVSFNLAPKINRSDYVF